MQMDVIAKVHVLQQDLAVLSNNPLLALPEATELLVEHLNVDVAGVYAFVDDAPFCSVLLAAHGRGAGLLERSAILHGGRSSAGRLKKGVDNGSGTARLIVADAAAEAELPSDYAALFSSAGVRSLATILIGSSGAAPLGALVVGKQEADAFDESWSSVWLTSAATGLLQHMRPAQVALAAGMLRTIEDAPDHVAAISALLQNAVQFMHRATNISMGVRLALLGDDRRSALLFEPGRARRRTSLVGEIAKVSSAKSVTLPLDPSADIAVRELPLNNTLLASAITAKKARFIRDCAVYMQNTRSPARDVFTHTTQPVSSVVVVPLLVNEVPFGALYFTQDTPCDFSNIQEALLGFVHCTTLTLHNKLVPQMDALWGMVKHGDGNSCCSFDTASIAQGYNSTNGTGSSPLIRQVETSESDDDLTEPSSINDVVPPLSSTSGRLSKVSSRRLCTEAMLQLLQQQITRGKRRSVELSFVADHLFISDQVLGQGGYGQVLRGSWHKRPAAIKVMHARSSDGEAVSDAMEMAVLSTLQHPNIVQVYSCLTDMVEAGPDPASPVSCSSVPGAGPRYRRLHAGEDAGDTPTYNIIVMEYCDRGTLGDAVRRARLFHRQLDNGSIGVDLTSVIDVLIEVAESLQYMHRVNLLHGDVKLDNVLLKTDHLHALGVTPKLADFGLTKILKEDDVVLNHSGAGTVTHLAPELFQAGSKITTAADVFAFGVMMWEFYTAKRPYAGLPQDVIIERVLRRGARPVFPMGAPADYAAIANRCWCADPSDRPTLSEVAAALQKMLDDLSVEAQAAQAAADAAVAAQQVAAARRRPAPSVVV